MTSNVDLTELAPVTWGTGDGSAVAQPSPLVLDTGTDPVIVRLNPSESTSPYGEGLRDCLVEVKNTATPDLDVVVTRQRGEGEPVAMTLATGAIGIFGPFRPFSSESQIEATLTPASGTIGAEVRAYHVPRIAGY